MPLFEAIVVLPKGEVVTRQVYAQTIADARAKLENSFLMLERTTVPEIPCVFPAMRY